MDGRQEREGWKGMRRRRIEDKKEKDGRERKRRRKRRAKRRKEKKECLILLLNTNFLEHIRLLISPHPLLYFSKSQVSSKQASKAVPRPPNSCACQGRTSSDEQVTCLHRNTCDSCAPKPTVPEDYLQAAGGHPAFFTSVEILDQPFR